MKMAKLRAEVCQAELVTRTIVDITQEGGRPTEMTVMARVHAHPERIRTQEEAIAAERTSNHMGAASEGFRHRKDALVTLAANSREEMRGHPRVMQTPS